MRKGFFVSFASLLMGGAFAFAADPAAPPADPAAPPVVPAVPAIPTVDAPICSSCDPSGHTGVLVQDGGAVDAPMSCGCLPSGCACEAPCDNIRLWVRGEYLLWWTKSNPVPTPLLVTAPTALILSGQATGVLGEPTTTVLLGQSSPSEDGHSGVRIDMGGWFDCEQTVGLEGSYFYLGQQTVRQSLQSNGGPGTPPLGVPYFSVVDGNEQLFTLAFPGFVSGGESLAISTQLQGAELNGLCNLVNCCCYRLDLLGGFRYLRLQEDLTFATNFLNGPATGEGLAGGFADTVDQFKTTNNFYGGQIGLRGEYHWNKLFATATAKVALGDVNEVTAISGSTFSNLVDGVTTATSSTTAGGIFAQPTNIGNHSQNKFAVAPEADVSLGYELTDWIRLSVGYDFLYISEVARPGNQIDRSINITQNQAFDTGTLVGPARPAFINNSSDFWAQGIHVGLEFRF